MLSRFIKRVGVFTPKVNRSQTLKRKLANAKKTLQLSGTNTNTKSDLIFRFGRLLDDKSIVERFAREDRTETTTKSLLYEPQAATISFVDGMIYVTSRIMGTHFSFFEKTRLKILLSKGENILRLAGIIGPFRSKLFTHWSQHYAASLRDDNVRNKVKGIPKECQADHIIPIGELAMKIFIMNFRNSKVNAKNYKGKSIKEAIKTLFSSLKGNKPKPIDIAAIEDVFNNIVNLRGIKKEDNQLFKDLYTYDINEYGEIKDIQTVYEERYRTKSFTFHPKGYINGVEDKGVVKTIQEAAEFTYNLYKNDIVQELKKTEAYLTDPTYLDDFISNMDDFLQYRLGITKVQRGGDLGYTEQSFLLLMGKILENMTPSETSKPFDAERVIEDIDYMMDLVEEFMIDICTALEDMEKENMKPLVRRMEGGKTRKRHRR